MNCYFFRLLRGGREITNYMLKTIIISESIMQVNVILSKLSFEIIEILQFLLLWLHFIVSYILLLIPIPTQQTTEISTSVSI